MTRAATDSTTTEQAPPDPDAAAARQRLLTRLGAGLVAAVLLGALAVMVVPRHRVERSVDGYCRRMADARGLDEVIATADRSQLEDAMHQLVAAEQAAPAEIDPQMVVVADYARHLGDAVRAAGSEPGAVDAALTRAVVDLNGQAAGVEAAGTAVQAYVRETCGLDLTEAASAN